MIKLTNVSKEYARRGPALQDVSFHIKKGQFAFLTGHSGSGKTCAISLVAQDFGPAVERVHTSAHGFP